MGDLVEFRAARAGEQRVSPVLAYGGWVPQLGCAVGDLHFALRQGIIHHVHHYEIRESVIVDICHIDAHRKRRSHVVQPGDDIVKAFGS